MSRNIIETVLGALVLLTAAVFVFFSYGSGGEPTLDGGYPLSAKFSSIEGIHAGSAVRISGIMVGRVISARLNPSTYLAVVRMSIDPKVKLPVDTVAEILSSGLLGKQYLALVPGSAKQTLGAGGEIRYTQSAVNLEDLIARRIFGGGTSRSGGSSRSAAAASRAASTAPKT